MNCVAGVKLQAVQDSAGAVRCSKDTAQLPVLGRAGTAADFPSSLQAEAASGRIGAVCLAGIGPPWQERTGGVTAPSVQELHRSQHSAQPCEAFLAYIRCTAKKSWISVWKS